MLHSAFNHCLTAVLMSLTVTATAAPDQVLPNPQQAEPANTCHEPASQRQWLDLLAKHPADPLTVRLYALRVGLCQMIDQQLITVKQAALLLEQERARAIGEAEENRRETADQVL